MRRKTKARWARIGSSGPEALEAAESVGVFQKFCCDGKLPSLQDDGLRQLIGANPIPTGGIFAYGPVGAHKTHLISARVINASQRGYSARLMSWPRFWSDVRATYSPKATETEADIIDRYSGVDFLAIDDIGAGKLIEGRESEAARVLFYIIVNERYEKAKITDFTSNRTLDELARRFDEPIARRIGELCTPYEMRHPG